MRRSGLMSSVLTGSFLAGVVLLLGGCATLTGGTTTNVQITTEPEGATATIGTSQCETPCRMSVSRDKTEIHLEKDGYKTADLSLDRSFRAVPTIFGNILWLPAGLAVDFIAGGAYGIKPVRVELTPEDESPQ